MKKTKMDWDCSRDVCQKTLGTYPTKKGTICIRKLIILNLVVFDCGEKNFSFVCKTFNMSIKTRMSGKAVLKILCSVLGKITMYLWWH